MTLVEQRDGHAYYTGPLDEGKRLARFTMEVLDGTVTIETAPFYVVLIADEMPSSLTDFGNVEHWGSCAISAPGREAGAEQAWRLALGSFLEHVDPAHLNNLLRINT